MYEVLLKIGYFERGLLKSQETLTKLTLFFFRTQSLLMHNIMKNKRSLELVISHPTGYKTS